MEEGGRRLEMKTSEVGNVSVSEVLVVNSGELKMSRVSSLMGRVRQRADMERRKRRRTILALLRRICDRETLDLWSTSKNIFHQFLVLDFPNAAMQHNSCKSHSSDSESS